MKRGTSIIYLLLFIPIAIGIHPSLCGAQNWEPVAGGITCPDSLQVTGKPIQVLPSSVYAMCVYGDKLYAGGMFTEAGNMRMNNIASWDGEKWDSLSSGVNGWVTTLAADYQSIAVGGVFNRAGGKYAMNVARWVDTANTKPSWYYYPRGFERDPYEYLSEPGVTYYEDEVVRLIIRYDGNTYVGMAGVCVWDSKKQYWADMCNPHNKTVNLNYPLGWGKSVDAMVVHRGKLYIVQHFYSGDSGGTRIFIWDDDSLKIAPSSFPNVIWYINCATASDSSLYVGGGDMDERNYEKNAIVQLNNNGTYKVIGGVDSAVIYSMVVYQNKLYVAGQFDKIGGKTMNNIACWDGEKWEPLGKGLRPKKGSRGSIRALCIYKGYLYAGGKFAYSGNKPMNNIARWKLDGGNNAGR